MSAVHAQGARSDYVYELVPSSTLPALDLSQSLKSKFLPTFLLNRVDDFLKRYNIVIFYMYLLAYAIGFMVPLVGVEHGRFLGVLVAVLGLPLALGSVSSLRYGVVRLMIHTYDFWFFSIVNLTTFAAGVVVFGDVRSLRFVIDLIGFQNMVLIDAQLRGINQVALATPFALFVVLALLLSVMLNQVDAMRRAVLFQYQGSHNKYQVSVVDLMVNGLGTLSILLLKIMYRVQRTRKAKARTSRRVQCAIFRVRIQLKPYEHRPTIEIAPPTPNTSSRSSSRMKRSIVQMEYVSFNQLIDSRRILLPIKRFTTSSRSFPVLFLVMLYAIGITGLALSMQGIAHINHVRQATSNAHPDEWIHSSFGSLVATMVFTGVFSGMYQRDLLLAIVTSFDFIFYSLQHTAAHLSICVIVDWDTVLCMATLTSWLWIHWVMTLDALTPMLRAKLRFHVRMAVPVVALFTLDQNLLVYTTLFRGAGPRDRVLWSGTLAGQLVEIRVVPFFVGRLLTLLLWSIRLLFRTMRASNCDAVILRGTVTYHKTISSRKRSRKRSTFVRVRHVTSCTSWHPE